MIDIIVCVGLLVIIILCGVLNRLRGTVINFHRGSSKGSNEKQELINQIKGKL